MLADEENLSDLLLKRNWGRPYDGGKREHWFCVDTTVEAP